MGLFEQLRPVKVTLEICKKLALVAILIGIILLLVILLPETCNIAQILKLLVLGKNETP